ncbi:amino acid/amide ABC transporter ATP-binding protein 2, HAAT family [Halobiforma haloterrestris]|uniref:Amino acid/amide ABC transporter ATP-binding protein 2, HAAT family n=1 Tax=Natronobacterium haloterrestre TaxID=148448 RepID=A0A1I1FL46_NATHA|nr:ABC transporter ATP-binding protein [Halobiforma haloterrestris]SFB97833.1 amino acid/amide ABC transporter ATP-binding protein 2, HAAT family [Halobiforma haloterrestris]
MSDPGDSADGPDPLLELEGVHTYYGESHVLQGVDLSVDEGEIVALIGRNGVGKTTTLRSILQLTPPREGTVRFRGEDVTGESTHDVAGRGIGWVPEERRMFGYLTVEENVRVSVGPDRDYEALREYVFDLFPDLERFREKEARNLSGGQQQMLAIARALVGDNDLLLVDEPSEGLAPMIVDQVVEALREASADTTMILVEQNFPLAMDLADRFYLLDHGTVVESGDTEGVTAEDERIRRYLSA